MSKGSVGVPPEWDGRLKIRGEDTESNGEEIGTRRKFSDNHGRKKRVLDSESEDHLLASVSLSDEESLQAIREGSISLIPDGEETYHGMVAHRGLLTESELGEVDWGIIEAGVFETLGTTREEIERLYCSSHQLPPADKLRRTELDARFLEIQSAGGNMRLLAIALDWKITDGSSRKMRRVLARARIEPVVEYWKGIQAELE